MPTTYDAVVDKGFARRVGFGKQPGLLVIDFINGFTNPASPLGSDVSEAIAQTNLLIDAARRVRFPIFFSTIRYDDPGCADAGLWIEKIKGLEVLAAGEDGWKIDGRLHRQPADPVIAKKFASCFFGTDLVARLLKLRIDTLIISGCTTSGCVRATAVDACGYGVRPIVVREAVADRLLDAHEQTLLDIDLKYGDVCPIETALDHMRALSDWTTNS